MTRKSDKRGPGYRCVVCSVSPREDRNRRYFVFPEKSSGMRNIWLTLCQCVDTGKRMFICEKHFPRRYCGVKKLKKGAVPTLFLKPRVLLLNFRNHSDHKAIETKEGEGELQICDEQHKEDTDDDFDLTSYGEDLLIDEIDENTDVDFIEQGDKLDEVLEPTEIAEAIDEIFRNESTNIKETLNDNNNESAKNESGEFIEDNDEEPGNKKSELDKATEIIEIANSEPGKCLGDNDIPENELEKSEEGADDGSHGSGYILKKKWKNLRDQFRYELKKLPKDRINDDIPTDEFSTWINFKPLWFLRDQIKKRRLVDMTESDEPDNSFHSVVKDDNNSSASEDIFDTNAVATIKFDVEEMCQNIKREPALSIEDSDEIQPVEEDVKPIPAHLFTNEINEKSGEAANQCTDVTSHFYPNGDGKIVCTALESHAILPKKVVEPTVSSYEAQKLQQHRKEMERKEVRLIKRSKIKVDEDEAFFNSLLPHLNKLGPSQKLLCRIDIQKVVYKHVYGESSSEQIN